MVTKAKNSLRALSVLFLMGLFFTAQAGEIDPPKKSTKEVTEVKNSTGVSTKIVLKAQTSYKWFQISGTYDLTDPVMQSDAIYLGEGTTPPLGENCGTDNEHQCVSGFASNQVNPSTNQLINDDQAPQATPRTKD